MRGIIFLFLLLSVMASAQGIVKGSGVVYTNGAPIHTINVNTDAELAIDTTSGLWYERSRDGAGWLAAGFRVQKLAGSSPPSGAPVDKESEVQLNDVDSLYRWRAGAWQHINKVLVYTAGTGISVTGTVIANTGDLSATNEGTLGVGAGSGTSSILLSNTSGATGVTINAAGILAISESTSSNGGSITLTATEVDGSVTNELQTLANTSDATSHTVTLSNSGGSVQFVEGSNITLTTTGTSGAGIVTISATTGGSGSTDLTFSGTSSPVTLNSSSGTDVTLTAGGINSFSASSGNITITATEVDGSVTNEGTLGIGAGGASSSVITSNTSGATGVTINVSGILAISESTSSNGGSITLTATEVDGSVTNELQTLANTSDATSHTVTLSNSGGSIQLVEGSNITLTTTGTSGAGIVTIASTGGGSTDLAFSGASSPVTLTSSTGTDVVFTAGSNVTLSQTGNNMTIAATGGGGSPSIITPSQITSTQNDYSPTGWTSLTSGSIVRISGDNGFRKITGFAALTSGYSITLINIGSNSLYIAPQHTGSSAANRVEHYEDIVMTAKSVVTIMYDGTLSRWTVLSNSNENYKVYGRGCWYDIFAGKYPSGLQENEYLNVNGSGNFSQIAPSSTFPFTFWTIDNGTSATADGSLYLMKQTEYVSYYTSTHAATKSTWRSPSALSNGTQRYRVRCVMANAASSLLNTLNNSLQITYRDDENSGKFLLRAVNSGGTETTLDSGVTFAVDTEYTTAITFNKAGDEATYYINGNMVGRITTNLPSATTWGAGIQYGKLVGTGTVTFYVNRVMAAAIQP